jgi:hypothetical protein
MASGQLGASFLDQIGKCEIRELFELQDGNIG